MPAIAFKIGKRAIELDSNPLARILSEGIMQVTQSAYTHAEFWIDGPETAARCFSAREFTKGVDFAKIDLTDTSLWRVISLPAFTGDQKTYVEWFCRGNVGRDYDAQGILGILNNTGLHDTSDRFCSEMVFDIGQQCLGWNPNVLRWLVAPAWTRGGARHGLIEMLCGTDSAKLLV